MADVFISYSKSYAQITRRLASELEQLGLSVWWDTELVAGESYRSRIQEEITAARAAIVIWTRDSISSEFVISEASRAHAQRKLIQVRTSDVDIVSIPAPFDVSHVPEVEDRKAITGALRRLGLLDGGEPVAGEASDWTRPMEGSASWRKRLAISAATFAVVLAGVVGIVSLVDLKASPEAHGAHQPNRQMPAMAVRLLNELSTGLQDSSLFEPTVRLGQRGLSSRIEVADELRRFTSRFAKVSCRQEGPLSEVRDTQRGDGATRARLSVVCDLTEPGGRTHTKRFPLEIETVRSGDMVRIAGMWQPEEMVLWQRREGSR